MLADTPNIDGPTRGERFLPEEPSKGNFPDEESAWLPVRRIGLEHEFFLVYLRGEPREMADLFLWECREAAQARGVLALEPDGDLLHVPTFSYLGGELLGAAVSGGLLDPRLEAYLDSFVRFASPYLKRPELVEVLVSSGGYKTTEAEVLETFLTPEVSLTREEGLSLVREACLQLKEQVSSLGQRYGQRYRGMNATRRPRV